MSLLELRLSNFSQQLKVHSEEITELYDELSVARNINGSIIQHYVDFA